ncbi:bacillithiol system redox-active protein YtxJ [soil metagenome]
MNARFHEIKNTDELENIFQKSFEKPVVIFKHSTTCPISSNVFDEISQSDAEINLVIIQQFRHISNLVAEKTGIRHESPQAIVVKDGKPIFHASHYDITAEEIIEELQNTD